MAVSRDIQTLRRLRIMNCMNGTGFKQVNAIDDSGDDLEVRECTKLDTKMRRMREVGFPEKKDRWKTKLVAEEFKDGNASKSETSAKP